MPPPPLRPSSPFHYCPSFPAPKIPRPPLHTTNERQVLRNQPDNMYDYGARYFAAMVDERAQAQAQAEAEYYAQEAKR